VSEKDAHGEKVTELAVSVS